MPTSKLESCTRKELIAEIVRLNEVIVAIQDEYISLVSDITEKAHALTTRLYHLDHQDKMDRLFLQKGRY